MEKKNAEGDFVNDKHWMELNLVVPLFCLEHRLRVVVHHCHSFGDTWSTYTFDGRDESESDAVDPLLVDMQEGMVSVKGVERSFGLHYDGEH
jgi:hypothetical protein